MQTDQVLAQARARRTLRTTPALARDLRQQAGLTQADVAAVLGVTRAAVSQWEAGKRVPRGDRAASYITLLRRAVDG